MKSIYVGTYLLYHLNVELWVWPDESAGRFETLPNRKSPPKISIGLKFRQWEDVVSILLHETFEGVAALTGCQYNPEAMLMTDSSAYLFVFDHQKFTRICEYQAQFVTRCLPDLADAYKKHYRKKNP